MGLSIPHALGRTQRLFVTEEATYGTFIKPVTGDAVKMITTSMEFSQERKPRSDFRQTRSLMERITGKKEVNWQMEGYLLPSGVATTPPDIGPLLKSVIGPQTIGGASVTYDLSATQTALKSLCMTRNLGRSHGLEEVMQEAIVGAWIEQMTIKFSGTEEPKISFQGGASDHYHTGTGLVSATGTPNVTLGAGEGRNFDVGSVVQFVHETTGAVIDSNMSTGFKVTVIAGDVLTLEAGYAGVGAGNRVVPFAPAETTAGVPLSGLTGSLTIDAVSNPITSFELTLVNQFKAVNDEFAQDKATDIIPGYRMVTGNIGIRCRRDQIIYIGSRKDFITRDLLVTCGDTAGKRVKINVDFAELDFSAVEVPEAEEATCTIPFTALAPSSGETEFSLVFD